MAVFEVGAVVGVGVEVEVEAEAVVVAVVVDMFVEDTTVEDKVVEDRVVGGRAVERRAVEHMAVVSMDPGGMAVDTADRDFHHYNLEGDIVDNLDIVGHDDDDGGCAHLDSNCNSDMDCCCNSGMDSCYCLDMGCCCNCLPLYQMQNTLNK